MGILNIVKTRSTEPFKPLKPKFNSPTEVAKQEHQNLVIELGRRLKESESLRREINLYVKTGDVDKDELIEKLFRLVYLLCSDEVFYRVNMERLEAIV